MNNKAGTQQRCPPFYRLLHFHLFAEITGGCLDELGFRIAGLVGFLVLQEHNAAADISGGDDGALDQCKVRDPFDGLQRLSVFLAVKGPTILDIILQRGGNAALQHLLAADAADRDHMITVGNEDRVSGGAKQDLAILSGNAAQLADGRILLKDDLPLVADEDLQRVAVIDNIDIENLVRTLICALD